MKRKLKFIWIDDDGDRKTAANNLARHLDVICLFIDVKPENAKYLPIISKKKPDLILIDQNLTDMGTGDMKKGSTISAIIKENNPTAAIACITGQDIRNIDSQQRLAFEAIFNFDNIKNHYCTMKSIAISFRTMKSHPPQNINELLKLLKAPKDELFKLETILPREIKENFNDNGIYSSISNWIRNILLERPGFLYDRLWAATLVGLNENGFKKVESIFEAAVYKGIFADDSKKRWWKNEILNILSRTIKTSGFPWEKGRNLPDINPKNYSKDYYSDYKEEFPEVVAFVDETEEKQVQMKMKYTVPHPKYNKMLFFEDIRMMKTPEA